MRCRKRVDSPEIGTQILTSRSVTATSEIAIKLKVVISIGKFELNISEK